MRSFTEIINAFATDAESGPIVVARELDEEVGTTRQWRNRNVLPDRAWKAVVEAAERRGIAGITLDVLATIAAEKARAAA